MSNQVQQLPSTEGVKDPAVREVLDALVNAWNLRNGTTGRTDEERFITRGELDELAVGALANALAGVSGAPSTVRAGPGLGGTGLPVFAPNAATLYLIDKLRELIPILAVPAIADVKATAENAEAGMLTQKTVLAQKDFALAQAINTIWAQVSPYQGNNTALFQDGVLAAASPLAAEATSWTQVQAAVIDPNTGADKVAAVRQDFNAYSSELDGDLRATWTVRANAGGRIAGIGLGIVGRPGEQPTSSFTVLADQFVVSNSDGNIAQAPFLVDTVEGIVHIKTAAIKDGSIGTAKIVDEIKSDNWDSSGGTLGWMINSATGSAFFNNVTARGNITADSVTANSITADNIQSGSIGVAASGTQSAGITSASGFRSVVAIASGGYEVLSDGVIEPKITTLTLTWDSGSAQISGVGCVSLGKNVSGSTTVTASISGGTWSGQNVSLLGVKR